MPSKYLSAHQIRVAALIAQAVAAGIKHYNTGLPCRRGHVASRLVSTGNCTECMRLSSRDYSRQLIAKADPKWRASRALAARKRRENNPKVVQQDRESAKQWARRHPGRVNARTRARFAQQQRSIPLWANRDAMREIYELANELGKHVDHIVPIISPLVCGLHCEANLQLLDARDNCVKGNRYWPDMP